MAKGGHRPVSRLDQSNAGGGSYDSKRELMDDYLDQLRRILESDLGLKPIGLTKPPAGKGTSISLMITREQRAALRERGFTDDEIRSMTPAQAHAHLGISSSADEQN